MCLSRRRRLKVPWLLYLYKNQLIHHWNAATSRLETSSVFNNLGKNRAEHSTQGKRQVEEGELGHPYRLRGEGWVPARAEQHSSPCSATSPLDHTSLLSVTAWGQPEGIPGKRHKRWNAHQVMLSHVVPQLKLCLTFFVRAIQGPSEVAGKWVGREQMCQTNTDPLYFRAHHHPCSSLIKSFSFIVFKA